MRIQQDVFIGELLQLTQDALVSVKKLKSLSLKKLNFKASPKEWSVLECIEHLNLYGNFYLPEIEKRIMLAKPINKSLAFKSSLIGDYFVRQVKADNPKKLKATQAMDSTGSNLNSICIDQFIKQLEKLEYLLEESKKVDLSKVKTNISLTRLFKLRLGDTLAFLVYHNERHIMQAERAIGNGESR